MKEELIEDFDSFMNIVYNHTCVVSVVIKVCDIDGNALWIHVVSTELVDSEVRHYLEGANYDSCVRCHESGYRLRDFYSKMGIMDANVGEFSPLDSYRLLVVVEYDLEEVDDVTLLDKVVTKP